MAPTGTAPEPADGAAVAPGGRDSVDVDRLQAALDDGRARAAVMGQHAAATAPGAPVDGSPHVFLPDGAGVDSAGVHNPGVELRWEGDEGRGFPVIVADAPTVFTDLVQRAAALAP